MRAIWISGLILACGWCGLSTAGTVELCGVDVNAGSFASGFEAGEIPGIAEIVLPADDTPLSIAIAGPAEDAEIQSATTQVWGSFTAPPNTGVTVNDVPAYQSQGQWLADVPLVAGDNTLTVALHALDGSTTTSLRDVTRLPDPLPVADVRVLDLSDIAPFKAAFGYELTDIASVAIDFNTDGAVDLNDATPDGIAAFDYYQPGRYLATFTLTPSIGAPRISSHYVLAEHPSEIRQTLCHAFGYMRASLIEGNISNALKPLAAKLQPGFEAFWTSLDLPDLSAAAQNLGVIVDGRFSPYQAELILARPDPESPGNSRALRVQFARSADGVWRISAM